MTTQWIATRTLTDDNGAKIEVRIGLPGQVSLEEWRCPLRIGSEPICYVHGMDAVQVLQLAFEKVRIDLQQLGRFTWEGGEPGDHGFTRGLPSYFGFPFYQRMEQIVDNEVQKLVDDLKKRPKSSQP